MWKVGRPAGECETYGTAWRGGVVEFYPGVEGVRDPEPERTATVETRKREARSERA